jgi:bacterioferritin-associated ferredoxin
VIVCHCNVLACADIRRSVKELLHGQSAAMVTPGQVFRCCGARPQCGGCMGSVSSLIASELSRIATE